MEIKSYKPWTLTDKLLLAGSSSIKKSKRQKWWPVAPLLSLFAWVAGFRENIIITQLNFTQSIFCGRSDSVYYQCLLSRDKWTLNALHGKLWDSMISLAVFPILIRYDLLINFGLVSKRQIKLVRKILTGFLKMKIFIFPAFLIKFSCFQAQLNSLYSTWFCSANKYYKIYLKILLINYTIFTVFFMNITSNK